ncbi:hypothetical protein EPK99_20390 [Neorhizobium lilium]|uniref:Chitinase n=1 Tax=Neorhizobium lilium TaxID=2503024 RepID=A0A3S3S416_9HYPH|nr:hypothetical protein EPK99_20390 [Neorhizobium lilium]
MNRSFFFDHLSDALYRKGLSQAQVNGHEAVLDYWEAHHAHEDDRWLAYSLATAFHETGRTLLPVVENLNYTAERLLVVFPSRFTPEEARRYARRPERIANRVYGGRLGNGPEASGDGWRYRGRGLVQITGRSNYGKFGLAGEPDRALEPRTAVRILVEGMIAGRYTGKSLASYFHGDEADWVNARKIINALDRASDIADYARSYYASISYTVGAQAA